MTAPKRNFSEKFLSGEEFCVWMDSRGLNVHDVASFFNVNQNTVRHYRKNGVSMMQALAISAVERGLPAWKPTYEDIEKAKNGSVQQDEE